jgi:hypothetical protein
MGSWTWLLVWFRGINFFGSVNPGSTLVGIWNNLICTFFLINSHGLSLVSGGYNPCDL